MILIYSEYERGQAALPETMVNGNPLPVRHYEVIDHFVAVDGGGREDVAWHDANELTALPGFRLATADEQNSYAASQQKKTSVRESGGSGGGKQSKQVANGG